MFRQIDITHADLPASLEGLRLAHLTDLHVRRAGRWYEHLAERLARMRLDMVLMTGDYMEAPRHAAAACRVMQTLCEQVRPRLGSYGIFGNHDTDELVARCRGLPVRWLEDDAVRIEGTSLVLAGMKCRRGVRHDTVVLARQLDEARNREAGAGDDRPGRRFVITLAHSPQHLPTAADLGVHLLITGHTHGGQIRLPTGHALVNSTDLPLRLTSGLLRHRDTLAVVCRGLGQTALNLRLFCPRQLPIYHLRKGPLPGEYTTGIENLQPW